MMDRNISLIHQNETNRFSEFLNLYLSQYSDYAKGWTTGFQFPAEAKEIFFSSPPHLDRL